MLGGLNSVLANQISTSIPMVSKVPTLILGMDVSPGQADVVSLRQWPSISRYRACVRTQSPKVEMIDSLDKRVADSAKDDGIMREVLEDFYFSSDFRDGVGDSQFNQVLNIELSQIIEDFKLRDERWSPKFVVIVAQKNHHTKFFQRNSPDNVQPGTVIDDKSEELRLLVVCTRWDDRQQGRHIITSYSMRSVFLQMICRSLCIPYLMCKMTL
ncbi:hypothetical protein BUALT_Bualt02G0174900 [Buddleja alternifolia]|uniref:Piwi domain-containing protein n=1 Tax=Buddleja alternifolia TaxID=168488 RepID=A0AAV6YBS9_9LAMI|nr:hypothetical protein BUALT_Bualt02G0174900 [Buddleja alternifolia]